MPLAFVRPHLVDSKLCSDSRMVTTATRTSVPYVNGTASIDAATHETAATLADVASFAKRSRDASDSCTVERKEWEGQCGGTQAATTGSHIAGPIQSSTMTTPSAGAPVVDHSHSVSQAQAHAQTQPPAAFVAGWPPHSQQPPVSLVGSNAQIVMSSIGFGIDPCMSNWGDATESAVRALRDAMERSAISLPTAPHLRGDVRIQVKIGVPARQHGLLEPMKVDVHRLTGLLPQSVTLLPIQVVVGGLLISSESTPRVAGIAAPNHPTICTAVACVTLQQFSPAAAAAVAAAFVPADPHGPHSPHAVSLAHAQAQAQAQAYHAQAQAQTNSSPWARLEQPPLQPLRQQLHQKQQVPQQVHQQGHPLHQVHQQLPQRSQIPTAQLKPQTQQQPQQQTQTPPPPQSQSQQLQQTQKSQAQLQPQVHHLQKQQQSQSTTLPQSQPIQKHGFQHPPPQPYKPETIQRQLPKKDEQNPTRAQYEQDQEQEEEDDEEQPDEEEQQPQQRVIALTATSSTPDRNKLYNRSNSMEMLAMISEELHERSMNADAEQQKLQEQYEDRVFFGGENGDGNRYPGDDDQFGDNDPNRFGNSGYNYKKLPPGITPKNNKRLFVKHNYRDYSTEEALPEEMYLMEQSTDISSSASPASSAYTRTPNAAFPLKLHETLSQIEADGYGNIVGWLPHGRSFKIHEQKEFVEVILPKYFVMTKKSSFLRQLNLYGFNRLSGVGPDQGSYYHEKFLRGLKFLCRRMTRQKVNGNGIRAAGNPDDEPVLSRYPSCPPPKPPTIMNEVVMSSPVTTATETSPPSSISVIASPAAHSSNISTAAATLNPSVAASAPSPAAPTAPAATGAASGTAVTGAVGSSAATLDSTEDSNDNSKEEKKYIVDCSGQELHTRNRSSSSGCASSIGSSSCGGGGSGSGGMVQVSFPLKLQRILDRLDAEGKTDIISWLPHGRAFLVHNSDRFVVELMPVYFNQTKFSSFQRQLHMYNFQRITAGRDKGAYHHPNFQRGKPQLCLKMVRTRVNGKGCRRPGNPNSEPNLYAMEPLPLIVRGTKIEIPVEMPASNADALSCDNSGDEA